MTADGSQVVLAAWGTPLRVRASTPGEAILLAKRAYADHLAETTGRRWVVYEASYGCDDGEDREIGATLVGVPTVTKVAEVKAPASEAQIEAARAALVGESPLDEVLASIARAVRHDD